MVSTIDSFRGQVLKSGDSGYDAARAVWNGMIDRRPLVIAQCLDVDDVITAVKHAKSAGLGVAIRGGGTRGRFGGRRRRTRGRPNWHAWRRSRPDSAYGSGSRRRQLGRL